MIYCFDSSGLLDGWARHYPESVFPSLWSRVRSVAQDGRAIAPIVVRDELKKKDDTLLPWCRKAGIAFCDVDLPQQQLLREVLAKFPRLVDTRKNRSGADPVVIALARCRGAVVVTGEKHRGTADKPKIPDVCDAFSVEAIGFLDFVRRERWTF